MTKLLASALALVLLFAAGAAVAQTIGVYADVQGGPALSPKFTHLGGPFDIVVRVAGVEPDFFAFEFQLDHLPNMLSGVFQIGEVVFGGAVDLGDQPGEYIVGVGFCEAASTVELVRLTMFPQITIPANTEIGITGSNPTSDKINGLPVVANCNETIVPLGPAHAWEGDLFGAGSLVINPDGTATDAESSTIGTLKARF